MQSCKVVQLFSVHTEEIFKPLAKKLFPVLLDVIGCGNKVISGYVNDACETLLKHTHIKTGIPKLCNTIRTSRSKLLKERCASYLFTALKLWDTSELDRFERHIESALKSGMSDASAETRATTRNCFHAYASKFQESASSLVKHLDSRTQRLLLESSGSSKEVDYKNRRHDSLDDSGESRTWASRPLKVKVPTDREVHRSPKYSPIRLNMTLGGSSSLSTSSSSPKRSDILKPSPVYAGSDRIRKFSHEDFDESDDDSFTKSHGRSYYQTPYNLDPPAPRRRSVSAPAVPEIESASHVTLGEPVLVSTRFGNYIGAVRYYGRPVDFAEGEWIGVEFEEPVGKNNGSVRATFHLSPFPLSVSLFFLTLSITLFFFFFLITAS